MHLDDVSVTVDRQGRRSAALLAFRPHIPSVSRETLSLRRS